MATYEELYYGNNMGKSVKGWKFRKLAKEITDPKGLYHKIQIFE